jgi:hypothetical protein
MVLFSELRRFRLEDERRRVARLRDLAVDLSARDYPPVTRLFYRGTFSASARQQSELPWQAVRSFDPRRRRIVVADLAAGRAAGSGPADGRAAVVLRHARTTCWAWGSVALVAGAVVVLFLTTI